MKIQDFVIVDGKSVPVLRDATPEEVAEWEQSMEEEKPTQEERIVKLEEQLEATKILLGVE